MRVPEEPRADRALQKRVQLLLLQVLKQRLRFFDDWLLWVQALTRVFRRLERLLRLLLAVWGHLITHFY